jgi:hypothetical protein
MPEDTPSLADLPAFQRTRETQLTAWPVISSLLFEDASSDVVRSIVGLAGLEVEWALSTKEEFSHTTRNRAYRPRVEAAYRALSMHDKQIVLCVIALELTRRWPAKLETIGSALKRVGWTLKSTPQIPVDGPEEGPIMKRDVQLQKLLLTQVRDDKEPPGLSNYAEADQVYNAALLINDGFVEGRTLKGQGGQYVSAVMTELTTKGHNFLGNETPANNSGIALEFPPEIAESIKRFRADHPKPTGCAFVMMRFGTTKAHNEISESIREALRAQGIKALRADEKDYHDELFWNILTYIYGCSFGIAVFERIEQDDFNPNVALEVGYTMALKKPVLLLKDKTLKSLNTDLVGKLYKTFDLQNISATMGPQILRWLTDRGLIPGIEP